MAVENQTDSMFAGNRHILRWNGITDADGSGIIDLTGRIVKFSLTRKDSNGNPLLTPILDFASDDPGSPVTIPNPVTGAPHVLVTLVPSHTATLAAKETMYYCELEVFEAGDANPVVVATLDLTIKPNLVNA
jgi:hypothetical protein